MSPVARARRVALAVLVVAAACRGDRDRLAEARARSGGGDPRRGRVLVQRYGCGACHVIPGVPGAVGAAGPPLGALRRRAYVGGVLHHTPDNLVRWIVSPRSVDPRTAMPDLGVSPAEARSIAAYLYAARE